VSASIRLKHAEWQTHTCHFWLRVSTVMLQGNKSDKIDACKLAERLRPHDLKPVYHGETGVRMLRELARSYLTVVKDLSRVMNRLKALYRGGAIPCAGEPNNSMNSLGISQYWYRLEVINSDSRRLLHH